jgi:hypothetical protein
LPALSPSFTSVLAPCCCFLPHAFPHLHPHPPLLSRRARTYRSSRLFAQIQQKDQIIESLLKQVGILYSYSMMRPRLPLLPSFIIPTLPPRCPLRLTV